MQLEGLQLSKLVGEGENSSCKLPEDTSLTSTQSPSDPGKTLKRYKGTL